MVYMQQIDIPKQKVKIAKYRCRAILLIQTLFPNMHQR